MNNYLFICPEASDYNIMYQGFDSSDSGSYICSVPLFSTSRVCFKIIESSVLQIPMNLPIVVIVAGRVFETLGNKVCHFLRSRFSEIKLALYLSDVVGSYLFDLKNAKDIFDGVFSYDEGDSKQYGISFCQEPFTYYEMEKQNIEYDLLFIGSAKNRISKIIKAYDSASRLGYNCLFYIFGVEDEDIVKRSGIVYNTFLDFKEVLCLSTKAKALLEVLEDDMYSPTTRFAEAVLYDRLLFSDSRFFIRRRDFSNVVYYSDIESVDWNEINAHNMLSTQENKELFSIDNMKKVIGDYLCKMN